MPEDGIGFGAYDSVKDSFEASFIEDSILDKIAKKIRKLIVECDAYPRFQDQLLLWDKRFDQQIAAEDQWYQRREEHERWAITRARWLNESAGPPEPGCCFEQFRRKDLPHEPVKGKIVVAPVLEAWFPPELCSHNCPEAELPLPPHQGEIEMSTKYAALSAIYDYRMKGQRKLGAGLDLKHYDLLLGIKSPVGERDGQVAQILKADEHHLWIWLDDIERDLQDCAERGGSGAQRGRAAPTSADVGTDPAGEDDQVDPPESPSRNNELQPTDIFRRNRRVWFVRHCGQEALCTHVEGFAICHDLLQNPGSYVDAQRLPSTRKTEAKIEDFGADEVIDERAEDEFKERAEILVDEVSLARRQGDEALVEQKLGELRQIQKTLKSAKNIRGKRRTLSSTTSEKHRKRVLAALRLAYQKLRDEGMGELADHLDRYVDVDGGSYIYRPAKPIDWRFE